MSDALRLCCVNFTAVPVFVPVPVEQIVERCVQVPVDKPYEKVVQCQRQVPVPVRVEVPHNLFQASIVQVDKRLNVAFRTDTKFSQNQVFSSRAEVLRLKFV